MWALGVCFAWPWFSRTGSLNTYVSEAMGASSGCKGEVAEKRPETIFRRAVCGGAGRTDTQNKGNIPRKILKGEEIALSRTQVSGARAELFGGHWAQVE